MSSTNSTRSSSARYTQSLTDVRALLERRAAQFAVQPQPTDAAVAAVLREDTSRTRSTGPELLFIERAPREGDPWSGQIAFPGGRREPKDADNVSTAMRETEEEVGLSLGSHQLLGELDGVRGSRSGGSQLTVSAFIFDIGHDRPSLRANSEVADTLWVPLDRLLDPQRVIDYRYPPYPTESFRGIQLDDRRVLWGLTLRLVEGFLERLASDAD